MDPSGHLVLGISFAPENAAFGWRPITCTACLAAVGATLMVMLIQSSSDPTSILADGHSALKTKKVTPVQRGPHIAPPAVPLLTLSSASFERGGPDHQPMQPPHPNPFQSQHWLWLGSSLLVMAAAILFRAVQPKVRFEPDYEWSALTIGPGSISDEEYEKQRLALDAKDREAMAQKFTIERAAEAATPGSVAGAWKWEIRKRIWDMMESEDIARFPRPVHHRIPNFVDAEKAALRLSQMEEFKKAKVVKVNPDTPQKMVRYQVLSSGKTLLTPQPRLRTGFFSILHQDQVPENDLMNACTSAGVAKYGTPISLDYKIKVDMIIVGSSCVTRTGARLGKGEGFAELEYGILRWMGAVDDSTLVVTTIHDRQLLDDAEIPVEKLLEHDVPVDVIVTPTQVIYTNTKIPKPKGILWHKLSPQKLSQIRVLRELKQRLEKEAGAPLPTGPDEVLPPLVQRNSPPRGRGGKGKGQRGGRGKGKGRGRD